MAFSAQICPKVDLGFKIQKTNVGIRSSILKIPSVPIFWQNRQLDFFGLNLPKNGFRVGNSENCWSKNQHDRDNMCANFQENWHTWYRTLTFST